MEAKAVWGRPYLASNGSRNFARNLIISKSKGAIGSFVNTLNVASLFYPLFSDSNCHIFQKILKVLVVEMLFSFLLQEKNKLKLTVNDL